MDSNLLKIFITVADTKSITLAAKQLNFAQSNVTSRIKQLEKRLGIALFHRRPKGVILNQDGEKLYKHATKIVALLENAILDMSESTVQERLIIGSTESYAAMRIATFLVDLHAEFPEIELELQTGTTDEVMQMVLNYKVNAAFISGEPQHKDLIVLNKVDEQIVVIEAKIECSSNVVLLFKKGCTYTEFAQRYFGAQAKSQLKYLEFGNFETILGCVKAGMGKAILPLSIVNKFGDKADFNITPLDKKVINIPTCLVCRKDYVPNINHYLAGVTL